MRIHVYKEMNKVKQALVVPGKGTRMAPVPVTAGTKEELIAGVLPVVEALLRLREAEWTQEVLF